MDKYEYKIRAEEIKTLISQKKYVEAAKVADTIDWSRVRSVMMLCTVSDVYKVNRRFEDAKLLLEMANERHPSGRMIIYSLCDLSIRMGEVVQAIEYYKDFIQIAPNDSGRYVLQYKLYEAQDVGLEERIAVLEELKKKDYREKWAYELAYLYHRVGLATKCVEECDELILWFGEGKYVIKAMELKLLHQPLSPVQQQKFDVYMMRKQGLNVPESMLEDPAKKKQDKPKSGENQEDMNIQVKTVDVGKYNTINLQKELAESMKEVMQNGQPAPNPVSLESYRNQMYQEEPNTYEAMDTADFVPQGYGQPEDMGYGEQPEYGAAQDGYEMQYGYAGYETMQPEYGAGQDSYGAAQPGYGATQQPGYAGYEPAQPEYSAVQPGYGAAQQPSYAGYEPTQPEQTSAGSTYAAGRQNADPRVSQPNEAAVPEKTQQPSQNKTESNETGFENYLSQEYDGQISLVVPEAAEVEKQITGQMNIEDIMKEWEKMKRENEEKRRQELAQRVMEQTGSLFRDFDETANKGVLERLQKEERIPVERKKRPAEKVIPAQTKIWAADAVENAMRQAARNAAVQAAAGTAGAVMGGLEAGNAVLSSGAGQPAAPDKGMAELSASMKEGRTGQTGMPPAASSEAEARRNAIALQAEAARKAAEALQAQEAAQKAAEALQAEEVRKAAEALQAEEARKAAEALPVEEAQKAAEALPAEEAQKAEKSPQEEPVYADAQPEDMVADTYDQDNAAEYAPADEASEEQAPSGEGEDIGQSDAETEAPSDTEENHEGADAGEASEEEEPREAASENRDFSPEEKKLFSSFVPTRGAMKKLILALDKLSLAAYTGNLIITGDPGADTMELAKNVVKDVKAKDRNFSGKLAKVTGEALNSSKKDPAGLVEKLAGGALVVEDAGAVSQESMQKLLQALDQERWGILVILMDTRRNIKRLTEENPEMESFFNAQFDIEALDNGTLVAYGCQYARMQEYAIDELGRLALHTRIEDMQTIDHIVTVKDVREIVDDAIDHANKKTPKHFMDVLFAKRYDEDDMIILHEGDFI